MVIGRRSVLAGVAAGCLARPACAALPVPPSNALAFRLIRHGHEIGSHGLTFDRQGDALTVHIAVDALVTLLSIPIVRYSHRVVESWQGGQLVGLTSETNKNGDREWMQAQRTNDGLVVVGSKATKYIAPATAIGTTYWNRQMLNGPMISLEDGVLLRPKVAPDGLDTIRLASGQTIPADHYNLSGAFDVDVWYDQANTWAGLSFNVADGSNVHYERL
jgi:hypothetical protein